ncbi:MAG TPA: hypothetical protein VH762_07035 [Gemmatimonadaceae bacterium]
MRSKRGFAGALVLLLALPLTLVYQSLGGPRAEAVIHAALTLGALLMALAVIDFATPKWILVLGVVSAGALAVVFLLQGLSELLQNARLTDVVYRVLGQRIEGWLVDMFLVWCVGVLLTDSRGRTKAFGYVAVGVAVAGEVYANWLAYRGTSLNAQAPALKLVVLLPVLWLLFESRKRSDLAA